jgi:cytochrome c-type biogenesis protein CcmH
MNGFLSAAFVLLCVALGFLLAPLLRRPRQSATGTESPTDKLAELYRQQMTEVDADLSSGLLDAKFRQEAKQELEGRMLSEWSDAAPVQAMPSGRSARLALAIGALIPLAATLLYWQLGNPSALSMSAPATSAAHSGGHEVSAEQIAMMVDKLARKLESEPQNAQGWAMLARSYDVLGRHAEAAAAYEKTVNLVPDDAALLADYADALAMAQHRQLAGKPMQIIRRALKLDPHNVKALALAGTEAFERRDYRGAANYWGKALKASPPEGEFTESLRTSLAQAQSLAGEPVPRSMAKPEPSVAAQISGRITLSAALKQKLQPDSTLFVFARAETGPRMPVAILRTSANALPMDFTLDDSSAMSPALKLSGFARVVVSARISRSGEATPQAGDLTGSSGPVSVGARAVQIEISDIVK